MWKSVFLHSSRLRAPFLDRKSGRRLLRVVRDLPEYFPNIWTVASTLGPEFAPFRVSHTPGNSPEVGKSFFRARASLVILIYMC